MFIPSFDQTHHRYKLANTTTGNQKILKVLGGGSSCVTLLIEDGKSQLVRKIAATQNSSKLDFQRQWLSDHQGYKNIPNVLSFGESEEFSWLDIPYYSDHTPFSKIIHQQSIGKSGDVLEKILSFLSKTIHQEAVAKDDINDGQIYLREKFFNKVDVAQSIRPEYSEIYSSRIISINGNEYLNPITAMKKILDTRPNLKNLTKDQHKIHGDLTVENILIKDNCFLLLDPNNENYMSDIYVELGKVLQSLDGNYESLAEIESNEIQFKNSAISFQEKTYPNVIQLNQFLKQWIYKNYSEEAYQIALFHEVIHFARLLPYKARYSPKNFIVYYLRMTEIINKVGSLWQ